jgi:hypothetical protein
MALLEEGIWPCLVLGAEAGEVDGKIKARVNVKFIDGPNAGRLATYEDEVNAKSSIYVARSLQAVGWQGKTLRSVKDDCTKWIASTGGKSTAEIKHISTKKGTIWDKCNSIGRGPKAMKDAAGETLADADEAMRRAMQDDGTAPPEEPQTTDDIPF